jgi:hypothetical protein
VALVREGSPEPSEYIESRLEGKFQLEINRDKLYEMTNCHPCFKPIPALIQGLNRHLKGWANYFSPGYVKGAYWEIDWFVRGRLIRHLQRRSQRPFRPPEGVPWYRYLQQAGLVNPARPADSGPVHA